MKLNQRVELKSADLKELRSFLNRFGNQEPEHKSDMITRISSSHIRSTKVLRDYHDLLLFLCAYPDSPSLLKFAEEELERLARTTHSIMHSANEGKKSGLGLSGIQHTHLIGSFSYEIVDWLLQKHPRHVDLYSCDIKDFTPQEIFRFGLLPAESVLHEKKKINWKEWNKTAFGTLRTEQLKKVIQNLRTIDASEEIRDHLFDSVKLFIRLPLENKELSRTFGRAPAGKIYFHTHPLIREIQLGKVLREKLPAPLRLTPVQKQEYVDTARTALMLQFRETDPVTFADARVIEVYDLGRGISVALYTMRSERRLPLDSYIGYMAFRNRLPCAYGGGWIFRNKSRIGINIFPPFRGGESALLFCRILQVYQQRYDITLFEAEPYQIGKNNPEGIRSGAFWFYHRLGFRPQQEKLFNLAEEEHRKILSDKTYRSSQGILTRLSESILALNVNNPGTRIEQPATDTGMISRFITHEILGKYSGDRLLARNEMEKKTKSLLGIKNLNGWTEPEKLWFTRLAPVIALMPADSVLSTTDCDKLRKWIQSRAQESEAPYIRMTKSLEKVWQILDQNRHLS